MFVLCVWILEVWWCLQRMKYWLLTFYKWLGPFLALKKGKQNQKRKEKKRWKWNYAARHTKYTRFMKILWRFCIGVGQKYSFEQMCIGWPYLSIYLNICIYSKLTCTNTFLVNSAIRKKLRLDSVEIRQKKKTTNFRISKGKLSSLFIHIHLQQ